MLNLAVATWLDSQRNRRSARQLVSGLSILVEPVTDGHGEVELDLGILPAREAREGACSAFDFNILHRTDSSGNRHRCRESQTKRRRSHCVVQGEAKHDQ